MFICIPPSQLLQTLRTHGIMFPSLSSYLLEKGEEKRERETDRHTDAHTAWERVFNLFTIPKPVCRRERNPSHLVLGALMTSDQTAL